MFNRIMKAEDDSRPLYVLVYAEILDKIENNLLPAGSRLPSEPKLAGMLGVSRSTLRQALLFLQEDGFIRNRQGSGNYVSRNADRLGLGLECLKSIPEMLGEDRARLRTEILKLDYEHPDSLSRELLRLKKNELIVVMERVYGNLEDRLAYAITFLPNMRLPEEINLNSPEAVLEYIHTKMLDRSERATSKILATKAGKIIAGYLGIREGESLLLFEELVLDAKNIPLSFSKVYFRTDIIDFTITRRKHRQA